VLWDVAGKDADEDIPASYLRGSHGVIFVVDLTRRETWTELPELWRLVESAAGTIPAIVALNKSDMTEHLAISPDEEAALHAQWSAVRTSAKTGQGVEELFLGLARGTLVKPETPE
jgi:small GTP-binding protein